MGVCRMCNEERPKLRNMKVHHNGMPMTVLLCDSCTLVVKHKLGGGDGRHAKVVHTRVNKGEGTVANPMILD